MISRFPLMILVASSAAIWALVLSGHGWVIPLSFFTPLSIVVGALSILLLVFDRWAWALPGIRRFTNRPDLRGTWMGVIRPSRVHSDGEQHQFPIEAFIVIRQTFTAVHLRLITRESMSVSLLASLTEEQDGTSKVNGIYRNIPAQSVRSRSPIHHGGLILNIGGPPPTFMFGHYWTDRQSQGELEVKWKSKECAADFETARVLCADSNV